MSLYTNGELRPISTQGTLGGVTGIQIYGPEKGNNATISTIHFSNHLDSACKFSLYRFTAATLKKILLYTFTLEAGDIVIDGMQYHLSNPDVIPSKQDYLYLVPSLGTINYSIQGLEYESHVINPPFSGSGIVQVIDKYGKPKAKCCSTGTPEFSLSQIKGLIDTPGLTYQNDDLIGGSDLEFLIINKQLYTVTDGDFTVDYDIGVVTFADLDLSIGYTIGGGPFNKKNN